MGVVEHVFAREPWVDSLQTYVKPYWDLSAARALGRRGLEGVN